MSRTTLELPERFPFATALTVRIGDVNYGGHLGHDAVLSLIHEARLRFLATLGFSEQDAGGAGLIMAEVVVLYRAQAYHGDRLTVEIGVGPPGRTGCDLFYRLTKDDGEVEVVRAKTGMVFFDYASQRVVPLPAPFRRAVESLNQSERS